MSFKLNPTFKRKLEALSQPRSVSLPELMPPRFMRTYTNFADIQEMFDKSALADAGEEDLKSKLESEDWNAFVRANTQFANWTEMLKAAAAEDVRRRFHEGGPS
jgi:hypothetical protein